MWGKTRYPINKGAYERLFLSDPVQIVHQRPESLTPDCKTTWGADEVDFQFFSEFEHLPDFINELYSSLGEPFRFIERNETLLTGRLSHDSPQYGRRYVIFYNSQEIGRLELCAAEMDYKIDKTVYAEVVINRIPPKVLPFNDLHGFLVTIAQYTTSTKKTINDFSEISEYEAALNQIQLTMLQSMWQIHPDEDFGGTDLEIMFNGRPDYYFRRLSQHNF